MLLPVPSNSKAACPHPCWSPDLVTCDLQLCPQVKMTMEGQCFESIQGTEATRTVQLKTQKEHSRAAAKSGEKDRKVC